MKTLVTYLREKLHPAVELQFVEVEKKRGEYTVRSFRRQMYKCLNSAGQVIALYDTWFRDGESPFFGFFEYSPSGELLNRQTYAL